MNRFALLSLYRSLTRHRLYAALNIGGLAVGIAVFLVLGLYVRFETSFEKWLPRHDGIYVVQTVWNLPESPVNGAYPNTMGGLLDQLREDFPGIVGTRIRGGENGGSVIRGGVATAEDVAQVDASFFRVFDLPMARGDGRAALASPTNALIGESVARKYFGTANPVGQTLTIATDAQTNYQIAGVFRDLPKTSDLRLSILIPLPRTPPSESWFHWGSTSLQTFLRFDTPAAARAFSQTMPSFVNRRGLADLGKNAWDTQRIAVLPIDRLHLEPTGSQSASRKITVVTLGLVGLLTLVIAVVNYVNLATARAGLRAREVAMRKVLGADRATLVRQFLGEAVLTVIFAGLTGLILAELGLPLVNAAGGLSLSIPYALVVPALAVLAVVVGILAGFYPAVLLSRFPAAAVLASARSPGGGLAGTRTREALVVLQFALAIAFMIGTTVLVAQTRHVRQSDLGFRRDGLLVLLSMRDSLVDSAQRRAVIAAVRDLPSVTGIAVGNTAVGGSGEDNSDNVPLPGVAGPGPSLRWSIVGPAFFRVYGTRLLAGRVFDEAHRTDDDPSRAKGMPIAIVINRRAVAVLGFRSPEDAVGKTVGGDRPRTIIGVVDDMRFSSPREPNSAAYYIYYREPERTGTAVASIRFAGDPRAMLDAVRKVWQRTVPQVPFAADTADTRLNAFYETDDRATRLFGIGAALAVLIGCVGLWGLASFNTARRIREIGIRKTLGASSADIVMLLVGQFLRPVLIANVIAWPLAFVSMRTWLAGFDDRITLSPLYFVGASLLALAIAVLTVLGQSLRASRAVPAWALRHD
ncbi:putative ABC transport system permease protein [Sphingomonas sp. PP-F2F-G114-C0414]|uniref:ABC transporter permease n=1 Tax=Sphingomonas sp. PP-F2F-G114-C0414 TaxID=2135662 RepID=UPI000EF91F01|nr:ABC transporter permease [Sphingomonas sp. PP-F2F-G114-C0414]RMB28697.1 putative ABC transport system permease protein [Sphingomonas sp. PP-F2F-G114-C0414]